MDKSRLRCYLSTQLDNFFPDSDDSFNVEIDIIESSLERSLFCFEGINSPVYCASDGSPRFNHLHGDQYATFLYFVSRVAFEVGNEGVYYKSALLNKALHGIDLFGHVNMPNRFLLVHPVGTIIGRGEIGENIVVYQGVTIGGKHSKNGAIDYPSIGENVTIYSNSSLIGAAKIPNGCVIGAGTSIIDTKFELTNKLITGTVRNNRVRDIAKLSSVFFKDLR